MSFPTAAEAACMSGKGATTACTTIKTQRNLKRRQTTDRWLFKDFLLEGI
jgi:hypothetical protein